jgi:hypothetical protein
LHWDGWLRTRSGKLRLFICVTVWSPGVGAGTGRRCTWLHYSGLLLASGWAFYTFSTTWGQLLQGASGLAAGPDTPSVFTPDPVQNLAGAPGRVVETLPWYTKLVQLYDYFWAGVVGWLWCLAVIVFSLRLSGGYWISRRLRTRGVIVVSEAWQGRCNDWARQLGILRQVCWLESACITEPLTLGFWKPVILFPAGLLLQLPPKQVEVLLLHELAHIRRLDYLANLFQLILEVCFFYHPLFWLLSREVRRQREFACDDQVVQQTTDPLLYARTLTNLQLTFVNRPNPFVMNALGNSAFAQRIYRIAGLHPDCRSPGAMVPFFNRILIAHHRRALVIIYPIRRTTAAGNVFHCPARKSRFPSRCCCPAIAARPSNCCCHLPGCDTRYYFPLGRRRRGRQNECFLHRRRQSDHSSGAGL